MDFRFLIVGAPFIIAFFYTLFWLTKWGVFNSYSNDYQNKFNIKNNFFKGNLIKENIFFTKISLLNKL